MPHRHMEFEPQKIQTLRENLNVPVVFVGMMATGKTRIGRKLAHILDWPFFDTDAEIEKRAGCSVAEIFTRDGEERFRAAEASIVMDILAREDCSIIATGGGAVTSPQVRHALCRPDNPTARSVCIWMEASPETMLARVRDVSARPLLDQPDPLQVLRDLMTKRQSLYEEVCTDRIFVDDNDVEETLAAVLRSLYDRVSWKQK
jgi:shikimate kinase